MKNDGRTAERMTLNVTEAAVACGISERTLRQLISRGDVPVVRLGRRVLVIPSELKAWLGEARHRAPTRDAGREPARGALRPIAGVVEETR